MKRFIVVTILVLLVLSLSLSVEESEAKKYALILAGDPKTENLDNDFLKHSKEMYSLLKSRYGYNDESIFFLYNEGEGDSSVDGDARKDAVAETFTELAGRIREGDQSFIYIVGHGGWLEGSMYFNLPGEDKRFDLSGEELDGLLDDLGGSQIIVMDTCYSGGWVEYLKASNGVIITSCASHQESNGELSSCLIEQMRSGDTSRTIKELYDDTRRAYIKKIMKSTAARSFGIKTFAYWSSRDSNGEWKI